MLDSRACVPDRVAIIERIFAAIDHGQRLVVGQGAAGRTAAAAAMTPLTMRRRGMAIKPMKAMVSSAGPLGGSLGGPTRPKLTAVVARIRQTCDARAVTPIARG